MSIYGDPVDHAARYWAERQIEPDPRLQEWEDAFAEFVAAGVTPKQIRRSYEERLEACEGTITELEEFKQQILALWEEFCDAREMRLFVSQMGKLLEKDYMERVTGEKT